MKKRVYFKLILLLFFGSIFSLSAQSLKELRSMDPSSITKSQMEQYGVTADDLQNLQKQFGTGESSDKGVAPYKPGRVSDTISDKVDTLDSLHMQKWRDFPEEKIHTYGKSFFQNKSLKMFQSASHIKAPEDYVLGPGDELNIAVWGYSQTSENVKIEDDGAIYPKLVGKIFLNGYTFAEARKIIIARLGSAYDLNKSKISIQLNYAKVIKVNIVGEVNFPGTYSISSINSAFNSISVAGGITDLGSVRNILIKRDNKIVKVLDVYKFLQDPTVKNDFFLQQNDYIIVQPAGNLAFIDGEVGRIGQYELLPNEDINDLVKYAGNFTSQAYKSIVHVERIIESNYRLIDVGYLQNETKKIRFTLNNGDRVRVDRIPSKVRNFVSVRGAIAINGDYEFEKGEQLLHLINRAGGVRFNAFIDRAYVIRTNLDLTKEYFQIDLRKLLADSTSPYNIEVKEFDQLIVFFAGDFLDMYSIEIAGSVRKPLRMLYAKDITMEDLILFAGGLKDEAMGSRIEISRVMEVKGENGAITPSRVVVHTINISNDLSLTGDTGFTLFPMDYLYVYPNPEFEPQRKIYLLGEVKYPGQYILMNRKETIKEVIERAGGFTEGAFLEGSQLYRKDDSLGFLVLNLKALYNENRNEYNYVLQAGDSIFIPKENDIVSLIGEMGYPEIKPKGQVNAPYIKGKRVSFYIKEFGGGFTKKSDKKKIYVISTGGHVRKTRRILGIRFYPVVKKGDLIKVGAKEKKEASKKDEGDPNKFLDNLIAKVTSVLTLMLLVDKLAVK